MSAIRTNPAYASLAYRRTIVHQAITYLRREFVGLDEDPKQKIICEEVLASEAVVPVEEVISYIEELEREHHALSLELGKFQFTRRNDEQEQQDQRGQAQKKKGHKGR